MWKLFLRTHGSRGCCVVHRRQNGCCEQTIGSRMMFGTILPSHDSSSRPTLSSIYFPRHFLICILTRPYPTQSPFVAKLWTSRRRREAIVDFVSSQRFLGLAWQWQLFPHLKILTISLEVVLAAQSDIASTTHLYSSITATTPSASERQAPPWQSMP